MRILMGIGVGVAVGVLFLIQAIGMAHWCDPVVFGMLHFPSMILVLALSQGVIDLGRSPSPYVVLLQWTCLGTLVGCILQMKHRSKPSPGEDDSDQGLRRTPVSKTSFSILRVIWVSVGLLFLLAIIVLGWVFATAHR